MIDVERTVAFGFALWTTPYTRHETATAATNPSPAQEVVKDVAPKEQLLPPSHEDVETKAENQRGDERAISPSGPDYRDAS